MTESEWIIELATKFTELQEKYCEAHNRPLLSGSTIASLRGTLSELDLILFRGFMIAHKKLEAASAVRPEPPKVRVSAEDIFNSF
jgi:hypothetical protein